MAVYRAPGGKMYRIQFRLNNRTYVKSAKTTDKRVAERMEAEWKAEIHGQQYLAKHRAVPRDSPISEPPDQGMRSALEHGQTHFGYAARGATVHSRDRRTRHWARIFSGSGSDAKAHTP